MINQEEEEAKALKILREGGHLLINLHDYDKLKEKFRNPKEALKNTVFSSLPSFGIVIKKDLTGFLGPGQWMVTKPLDFNKLRQHNEMKIPQQEKQK